MHTSACSQPAVGMTIVEHNTEADGRSWQIQWILTF